ncbi:DNA-directed RNA polymerase specialized sigma subunit [Paenibacillus shirakamiensis]|uniref:DNA-directed RNA polymerase specialized sigma subunit n=1 Tax=Paenibacillus shirakamiensis TaxID=1265935 RepID=A0ABS4JGB6_9BACL|nr:helix-turn-helix domain-containing protein [Paenibacillus shirakamiensis]MBP2000747.1 DNA-directed RNA polymerase specialized sigma subunit [Paenibacillus shirakamiensis]
MTDHMLLHWMKLAQQGDKEALYKILHQFSPLIKKHSRSVRRSDQEDLEQSIHEKLTEKILAYDIHRVPNFSEFMQSVEKDSLPFDQNLKHNNI